MRAALPLSKRPVDVLFIAFFALNLLLITYIIDLEQLVIADPRDFAYPSWPPAALVDLVHWWGRNFDPALMARPPWWRATIWIDVLLFGPFYALAIYAYARGRAWIRVPSIVWGSVMMTNVTIILFEEMAGPHATPAPGPVLLANAPWFLLGLGAVLRMARADDPFARADAAPAEARAA